MYGVVSRSNGPLSWTAKCRVQECEGKHEAHFGHGGRKLHRFFDCSLEAA